jgi:transcriptional regulator of arginine metabolism
MMQMSGFISMAFSGNLAIIKTRPGYASSLAWNIDNSELPYVLGTIAGADTIFVALKEGTKEKELIRGLNEAMPKPKE